MKFPIHLPIPFQCILVSDLNGAHVGYNCPAQVLSFQTLPSFPQQYPCCEDCGVTHECYQCQPKNPDYFHEQNSCYDSDSFGFDHCQPPQYTVNHPIFNAHNDLLNANNDLLNSQNEITIAQNKLMDQLTSMCAMVGQFIQRKQEEKRIEEEQTAKAQNLKIPVCYDDDDDCNSTITPNEPVDSLSIRDEHLNTISATESDKFIKSCVENLVPNPCESEGENSYDVHACFTTFSNVLFDADDESDSKSLLNRDSSIISSSSKIDSLLDEFAGELTLLKSILPGIDETDCYHEDEIRFTERLLYDNSSPCPPEEFVSENSNPNTASFFASPIPNEDSDSLMEEIDLSYTPDDPMPPSIEDDDYDSERDILILKELPSNYSLSLSEILRVNVICKTILDGLMGPPRFRCAKSGIRTSWNEFSIAMASAVICLSKGQRFNFSKYIFDSLVRNVDRSSKFYMYPCFIQLIIQNQVGDLSTHTTRFISPALTQKVFASMRRVGKGFSGVEIPLFEGMIADRQPAEEDLVAEQVQVDAAAVATVEENVAENGEDFPANFQQVLDICSALIRHVEHLERDNVSQKLESVKLKARVKKLEKTNKVKSSKFRRLRKVGASRRVESSDDMEDVFNQGRMMNEDEGFELVKDADIADTEGRQADKQAKIYNIDLDHSLKDKGKGIMVETPKPMKKKDQIELDAEYARKLHEEINKDDAEFNKDIDWDTAMDHVNRKSSNNPQYIKRYQGIKKRPQTESKAHKNTMIYLKNTTGYKMDFFKGMSYADICLIFQSRFDENMRFLFKSREKMEEEDEKIIKSINETPTQKASKRRKLNEEA
uniref:Uncharacterized protein n=1 Tax=Tanacetum cinerariifolium TaxID=118510 RepID=A0A6L2MGV8_TANCI|nr:hypothetical protein [Tanacetum cinerariifolium]